jgi:AraC-like DNA-binding protein
MCKPWPGSFEGAIAHLLAHIAAPTSSAESIVLRSRLATIAERAARFHHDMFHRLLCVPTCRCDVIPTDGGRWNDGDMSPFEAFRVWGLGYEHAFESLHQWPLAIRAALLFEDTSHGQIGVNSAASVLGCSRSVLTHTFTHVMGVSMREYDRRIRLRRAVTILRESDCAVDAVAALCGYAHAQAFHRAFREATNVTPSAFRGLSAADVETLSRTRLAVGAELRYSLRYGPNMGVAA